MSPGEFLKWVGAIAIALIVFALIVLTFLDELHNINDKHKEK